MAILFGGIAYVTYGVISTKYREWTNTYLSDDNLFMAFSVPILWFIYSFAIYHYFDEWVTRYQYDVSVGILAEKLILEIINLVATILTTCLLTGANRRK